MSGLLLHSQSDVALQAFIDAGLLSNPATQDSEGIPAGAWPGYEGIDPDSPDEVVVFKDAAGRGEMSDANSGITARHLGLQLTIRGRTKQSSAVKANALQHAMENLDPALGVVLFGLNVTMADDGTVYRLNNFADVGDVLPVGYEEGTNRFIHTINVTVTMRKLS